MSIFLLKMVFMARRAILMIAFPRVRCPLVHLKMFLSLSIAIRCFILTVKEVNSHKM